MKDRYESFYKNNWEEVYGFWYKIITRGEFQVKITREIINKIKKEKISILDVGCGKGDEIKEALSHIKNKRFNITANDTSKEALVSYSKNNNTKQLIQERLEDLPSKISKKFDFILFSHCLYGVNLNGLFNKYLRLLSNGGCILIFLDSRNSGIKKIQQKFWKAVHNTNFDENTAEDIIMELSKSNIKHEVIKFSNFMDLNKLQKIKKDGMTSLLIPFAFRTHNIDKETIKEVVSYIKKQAKNKRLENETFAIIIKNQ